jgi:hypothetical protein
VLLNLLANALKFTAQGEVAARLTIGPGPGDLRFEVVDTGIGIAPEVQARLFQRFSQADSSISRSYGGAGLGLAISKALVTQMGGEIGVDSALGEGSRFWINCPPTVVAAGGPPPRRSRWRPPARPRAAGRRPSDEPRTGPRPADPGRLRGLHRRRRRPGRGRRAAWAAST